MNKREIINAIAGKTGLTKRDSELFVDAFADVVTETLAKNEKVQLVGFGYFEVRTRAERTARNPLNGEKVTIPEHPIPVFKAGKLLKEAVDK